MCSLYHGVGLFSLIFLKRKGATVSETLEKGEFIVSATSSCSALLDMLSNFNKSGILLSDKKYANSLIKSVWCPVYSSQYKHHKGFIINTCFSG